MGTEHQSSSHGSELFAGDESPMDLESRSFGYFSSNLIRNFELCVMFFLIVVMGLGLGAFIIGGNAKSGHPVVMRFLIAGIAITKQRCDPYSFICYFAPSFFLYCQLRLICFAFFFIADFPNFVFIDGQNTMDIDPIHRHDIPRHEIKMVCFRHLFHYYYYYVEIIIYCRIVGCTVCQKNKNK